MTTSWMKPIAVRSRVERLSWPCVLVLVDAFADNIVIMLCCNSQKVVLLRMPELVLFCFYNATAQCTACMQCACDHMTMVACDHFL